MSRPRRPPMSLHGRRPHVGELPVPEDVDREIRAHLDLVADELVAEGWELGAAREEARRRFGDVDDVRRRCEAITRSRDRSVRNAHRWEGMMQDIRYAVRNLLRRPGFAAVALVTVALGVGANTAIFSVVDAVLLRPLPYPEPEALVSVLETNNRGGVMSVAWANLQDWREQADGFADLAAVNAATTTVLGGAEPVRARVATVSDGVWTVFPARPLAGRLTVRGDHRVGAAPVVVVSRSFADRVLGGVEAAVGRTLEMGGIEGEVVGVLPDGSTWPSGVDVWAPAELVAQGSSRTAHNWTVIGRLEDPAALPRVARELDALTLRLVATDPGPADYLATGVDVVALHERVAGDTRRPLLLLFGAAGFVLLVACTNLASALLARGTVRTREFAVRASLGAPRGRLVRQLLTESVVLAVLGAVLGVGVAWLALDLIVASAGGGLPRAEAIAVDGRALLFTGVVALVTALTFGLLPALRLTVGGEAQTLRGEGRGSTGGRGGIWNLLVGTEVALALVLLVGSGLLIRSFANLLAQERGFDEGDVVTSYLTLSGIRYPSLDDHRMFWERLVDDLEGRQGVAAAGVVTSLPLQGAPNGRLQIDGHPTGEADAIYVVASGGAFEALDIPLTRGRLFDERDGPEGAPVALVNEAFVREYWPDGDPVGRQVTGGGMDNYYDADPPLFATVVGVVGDVRYGSLERAASPAVYFPLSQRPFRLRRGGELVVEAAGGEPGAVAALVRERVRAADADVPIELADLSAVLRTSLGNRTFMLGVLGAFAVVALVLAAVGVYGVVSYTVARRTREIGIRLALGAPPERVHRGVLAGALTTVGVGLVTGVIGGIALSGVLRGLLHEVSVTDPLTYVVVALGLLAVGTTAAWLPARRALKVDPMITMKAE